MKLEELFEGGRSVTVKGKVPEDFASYIRSERELKDTLMKLYGSFSVDNIIRLFAEENVIVADNVDTLVVPTEDLYRYREYDREMVDGYTGKATQQEYDELKQSIKKSGIQQAVTLEMTRNRQDGSVRVLLGEGNHRLKIARELGIKTMPLHLYYRK